MASTVISIQNATVKFADDVTGIATAPDFKCQVLSAAIQANPKTETVPATFCGAEFERPKQTGWALALSYLQDWGVTPDGLSQYLFDNDTVLKYFEISLGDDAPGMKATGECYIVAGPYGGDAQTPLQGDVSMPCPAKPIIGTGAAFAAAAAS